MQSPFTFHNIEEKVAFLCQGKTIDKVGKKTIKKTKGS